MSEPLEPTSILGSIGAYLTSFIVMPISNELDEREGPNQDVMDIDRDGKGVFEGAGPAAHSQSQGDCHLPEMTALPVHNPLAYRIAMAPSVPPRPASSSRSLRRLEEDLAKSERQRAQCHSHNAMLEHNQALLQRDCNQYRKEIEISRHEHEVLQKDLDQTVQKCSHLERQVEDLKHSIAAVSEKEGQISDQELKHELDILAVEVQTWALSALRREKLVREWKVQQQPRGIVKILEDALPNHVNSDQPLPHLIFCAQAIISNQLMKILRNRWGFCQNGMEEVTAMSGIIDEMSKNEEDFNHWRWATNRVFLADISDDELEELAKDNVNKRVENVGKAIKVLIDRPISAESLDGLKPVFFNAVKLIHLARLQRAQYGFDFPTTGEFDPASMEDEHGRPAPKLDGEKIAVALFPLMWKRGDGLGKNMSLYNVISKARVACFEELASLTKHDGELVNDGYGV